MKPVIFGLSGESVSAQERAFFTQVDPAGYILFKRNIRDRAQVRALTDDLRALSGREDLLVMIDQEGGRVARMQPPQWPAFPAAAAFEALYELAPASAIEAARCNARALAAMLREVGINVDAMPMLDVRQDGASDIVGDRAYGAEPMRVAALGRASLEGLQTGGVVGIVKHMPGHGRALVDSHEHLPAVSASAAELEADIAPFRALNRAPIGMTAHIIYEAWDKERPASLSPIVIGDIIRGEIGFDGLLMSDDLDMKALAGDMAARATGVIAAGCDLALNCWGRLEDMSAIAAALPDITDRARERLDRAMATIADGPDDVGMPRAMATRDALLGLVAQGVMAHDPTAEGEDWDERPRREPDEGVLTIAVESFEGPLDLLLNLARAQKVDLKQVSILALVEQYLRFIESARVLRLELAADYLVMAAWLAYLKSAMLLPKEAQPDPSPEELALRLHLRLQRLEAMREAGARLFAHDRLGRDVFARGMPEGLHRPRSVLWQASLYDLIQAYGHVKLRTAPRIHIVARRAVMTLDEAIERVSRLIGVAIEWTSLERFLPETSDPALRRSAMASSFVAALELARQGRVELDQQETFAPLMLRAPGTPDREARP